MTLQEEQERFAKLLVSGDRLEAAWINRHEGGREQVRENILEKQAPLLETFKLPYGKLLKTL